MRCYILTKKKLSIIGIGIAIGIITMISSIRSISIIASASNQSKKLPIYCVEKEEKVISISFDAAWGNEYTTDLLNILKKYDIKTTFFLVGDWVDKYPESVKEIYDAGHDVSNHSNTHPHMPQLSSDKMVSEIQSCNDKIEKITGKRPILFRPPYGDYNNAVIDAVKNSNMYCIQWDVDSLDWKDPSPEDMKKRVVNKIKPGSIVLFHNGAKNTPKALPMTIEAILSEGYKIVPISEIIHTGNYTLDHEGRQHPQN